MCFAASAESASKMLQQVQRPSLQVLFASLVCVRVCVCVGVGGLGGHEDRWSHLCDDVGKALDLQSSSVQKIQQGSGEREAIATGSIWFTRCLSIWFTRCFSRQQQMD